MAQQAPLTVSHINNIQLAEEEEEKGNIDKAIQYYEAAIKDERADELPYNRLMILYRKEKKFKDELRVINKGIEVFTDFYKKSTAKSATGKKLSALSDAFMMSAGLKDKQGELVYQPEPIGKWMKRKEMVEGKTQGARGKAQGTRDKAQGRAKDQVSRTKGKAQGTGGKVQGTRDKAQGRAKDQGSRTKGKAQGTGGKVQGTRDKAQGRAKDQGSRTKGKGKSKKQVRRTK